MLARINKLYKEHINPEPDGYEIHQFYKAFGIGTIFVMNPDEELEKLRQQHEEKKYLRAENWILENSNLIKNLNNNNQNGNSKQSK